MADAEEFLIIKGKRILLPDCISSGSIIVKNGKIVGIERGLDTTSLTSNAKVSFGYIRHDMQIPGLHVHEPKNANSMPVTSPVCSSRIKSDRTFFLLIGQIRGRERFCVIENHLSCSFDCVMHLPMSSPRKGGGGGEGGGCLA